MYFHHDTLDKMTNMVKKYITDYLHDDVAAYDVQRIVSILWHCWYYVDCMKGFHAILRRLLNLISGEQICNTPSVA